MFRKYQFSKQEIEELIKNADVFLAHLSVKPKIPHEKLIEHILLVQDFCFELIEKNKLEDVITKMIKSVSEDNVITDLLYEAFFTSIVFHDFGKINPDFQIKKMKQENFERFEHELGSKHSSLGAFIFILYFEQKLSEIALTDVQQDFTDLIVSIFSYPIKKHHGSRFENIRHDLNFYENLNDYNKFTDKFNIGIDKKLIAELNEYLFEKEMFSEMFSNGFENITNQFPLFALLKLNYSLLTASDYLATSHFMNQWTKKPDLGILTKELKQKIIENAENSKGFNKKAYSEFENYTLEFPKEQSNDNLNRLRQNLSVEIINGIRTNPDKNLFYIEAPTGGGKTNLSMLALAEFLRADLQEKINPITKVFYVFPFTTLITQTHQSIKETLGLDDSEMIQLHSKAGFHTKKADGAYGEDLDNYIDYLFVNYPVTLLSHIRFFDILKTNRKEKNYLLHRLANSVVIIDELQTYAPAMWDKLIYFIDQYAKFFNVKFILMSATLPKIDKLLSEDIFESGYKKPEFINLNQHKDKYFTNPNFAERVDFNFDLIEDLKPFKNDEDLYLENLHDYVLEKSKNYKQNTELKRVHTIIEFIFKKSASNFYKLFEDSNFFNEIFLLSGTTLEPRRKEIISKLKSKDYKNKNILLITTQVVEAGVDIDMDLGFKDTSLIDSDEQLAGRINRNINKPQCILYLFNFNDAHVIYGKDERYKQIQNKLADEYQEILKSKKFDIVYSKVMDIRNAYNKQESQGINLHDYLSDLKRLDFPKVDEGFKLIDSQNTSIYVPIEIDIEIPNSKNKNFSESELEFLAEYGKYTKGEKKVNGEKVWEIYKDIILNRGKDFTQDKIKMTKIQGILSKFSFSIFTYSKDFIQMQELGVGEEKYGYYYLNHSDETYDYKNGINDKKFGKAIFF